MSSKATEISKEAFESLKKNRDALVAKRNALNVLFVYMFLFC
jgi:hypothetical protein